MKLAFLAGPLGLTLLSSAAFAQVPAGAASPIDRQFVGRASASNTFEIRSSEMALRRSRDPAVRDMARWMIESHTMAERMLGQAASSVGEEGSAAPVVNPTTEAMLNELGGLSGAAFDQAYVTDQVTAHALTAQQMSDYGVQGSDGPLLRYEALTLPEVNAHLAHFEALQRDMVGGMGRRGM